jgi:two-component system, OmpR family, alkaline phosphatase synthesis response regulator PhoP
MSHKREKKNYRILIVDDDTDILDLLSYNLDKEGYKVKTVGDSSKALKTALLFKPDLIVLDIMMPVINGIEICKQLRQTDTFKNTYIFFLTAKGESYYQVAALDTGGDDYIEKVVGLRVLIHRIKTVLNRKLVIRKSISELSIGSLKLNRLKNNIEINGSVISLSKPEFDLLFFFAQNPKRIIGNESLNESMPAADPQLAERIIDNYISNLTYKIGRQIIKKVNEGKYKLNFRF